MKNTIYLFSVLLLCIAVFSGCSAKTVMSFNVAYPNIGLNNVFKTKHTEYIVYPDNKTGELILAVKNVTNSYSAVTVTVFVSRQDDYGTKNSQTALNLQKNNEYAFSLPFTTEDLPLKIHFTEDYISEKSDKQNTYSSIFTVGIKKKKQSTEKVRDITNYPLQ